MNLIIVDILILNSAICCALLFFMAHCEHKIVENVTKMSKKGHTSKWMEAQYHEAIQKQKKEKRVAIIAVMLTVASIIILILTGNPDTAYPFVFIVFIMGIFINTGFFPAIKRLIKEGFDLK